MRKTVAALYDDPESARKAMRVLVDNGFNRKRFSLITLDATGEYTVEFGEYNPKPSRSTVLEAGTGTGFETAMLGFSGLLVGLGVITITGIGPLLAAGPLAAVVSGLVSTSAGDGTGRGSDSLFRALVKMDVREEYAYLYVEGVRRGGTLLVVSAPALRRGDAAGILNHFNPVDVDKRAEQWLEDGWNQSSLDELMGQYNGGYSYYDQDFRTHFSSTSFARKYLYEDCEPAYRFGYNLGRSKRYHEREWSEIEPEARQAWENQYPGTWSRFSKCIRFAWKRSKDNTTA